MIANTEYIVLKFLQTHYIFGRFLIIVSPSSMKSKLSLFPRISCIFSSSKDTDEKHSHPFIGEMTSVYPTRHLKPILVVADFSVMFSLRWARPHRK